MKTRIVAHKQQVVRIDRETRDGLERHPDRRLLAEFKPRLATTAPSSSGITAKGVVTQPLLDEIKTFCRAHGIWLSLDPKPVHHLDLSRAVTHHAQPEGSVRAGRTAG